MQVILAIDQGTTSSRAVVFHPQTFAVLGTAQQEIQQHYPQDGWVEHEPEEIWYSVAQTCRQALSSAGVQPAQVSAIGITNQRETIVVWNRQDGRPVHRAIVWQDRRTANFCKQHAEKNPWIQARTGLLLDPYFSGTKLRWLLQSSPALNAEANSGRLAAGTIDSFLIHRLTAGQVHATDWSNASRTLLFNIHTAEWDEELLQFLDVPRSLLPEARPSTSHFGVTHRLDFLPDGVPIFGVAGDQQAALFGQTAFGPGEAKCTYGTGAFFLVHTGQTPIASQHRLLTTIAATTGPRLEYALEGAVFIAGAAVQWLRDGLHLFRSSSEVQSLALQSNPTEPVVFVPGFVGLGAPHWEPDARGAIFGLTRATTAADLGRAALEGVAHQVADLLEAAEADLVSAPMCQEFRVKVDGGMARNDWFLQCQADLLGRPIWQAQQAESTALGAAFLAALGSGQISSREQLRQAIGPGVAFAPKLAGHDRDRKRKTWKSAVQATIAYSTQ